MGTKSTASILLLLMASPLLGEVKLPAIFGDHMVLQRDAKVPIWGWASPNEAVSVTAGEAKASGVTGADGKWTVALEGLKASDQPIDVTIVGKNSITLHDVLVGDVWVCSGQSNMEFGLGGGKYGFGGAMDAAKELTEADHPTVRLFLLKKKIAFEPVNDCEGSWQVCSAASAGPFSAVGYFFGVEIQADQHVPVGMIGTYWGGTPAESWASLEALKATPELQATAQRFEDTAAHLTEKEQAYEQDVLPKWEAADEAWKKSEGADYLAKMKNWKEDAASASVAGQLVPLKPVLTKPEPRKPEAPDSDPHLPTVLSNGMIAPIATYAIKGAIWYQGESNAGAAKLYQTLFPTMITDWRTRWGQGNFPFIWVQLANFMARSAEPTQASQGWPGLREAQSMTMKLPNTGQAVIIDIGDGSDIHPKDKRDVGKRLALAARHVAYGEDLVFSGPTYDSMKVGLGTDGSGTVRIHFKNVGSGLTIAAAPSTQPDVPQAEPAKELEGFSIAGDDQKFVWAKAAIEGDNVIVSSPDVHDPKAVRYAWANNPEANLYNKEGLPASPFRTDDWEK